jgi:hypothetical protein
MQAFVSRPPPKIISYYYYGILTSLSGELELVAG